jgi:membrane associated rhomboid family serine protease
MFLPLNDTESSRYEHSHMTLLIIWACTIILMLEYALSDESLFKLFYYFGCNPVQILNREGLGALSAITSTFLHGDFWHLLFNMWALWVFGRRVEDACGPWRFLAFYLFCGVSAAITFTFIHSGEDIPAIGASGAIFGVMGAYLLLYPEGRIRTLILVPVPIWPRLRAFWVVLFFILTEIPAALDVFLNDASYSTGHWAHIGGFFGAVTIIFFIRPDSYHRYINHLPL